jgi:hypothetical protein
MAVILDSGLDIGIAKDQFGLLCPGLTAWHDARTPRELATLESCTKHY